MFNFNKKYLLLVGFLFSQAPIANALPIRRIEAHELLAGQVCHKCNGPQRTLFKGFICNDPRHAICHGCLDEICLSSMAEFSLKGQVPESLKCSDCKAMADLFNREVYTRIFRVCSVKSKAILGAFRSPALTIVNRLGLYGDCLKIFDELFVFTARLGITNGKKDGMERDPYTDLNEFLVIQYDVITPPRLLPAISHDEAVEIIASELNEGRSGYCHTVLGLCDQTFRCGIFKSLLKDKYLHLRGKANALIRARCQEV